MRIHIPYERTEWLVVLRPSLCGRNDRIAPVCAAGEQLTFIVNPIMDKRQGWRPPINGLLLL